MGGRGGRKEGGREGGCYFPVGLGRQAGRERAQAGREGGFVLMVSETKVTHTDSSSPPRPPVPLFLLGLETRLFLGRFRRPSCTETAKTQPAGRERADGREGVAARMTDGTAAEPTGETAATPTHRAITR